jgi:hypothetical protein
MSMAEDHPFRKDCRECRGVARLDVIMRGAALVGTLVRYITVPPGWPDPSLHAPPDLGWQIRK